MHLATQINFFQMKVNGTGKQFAVPLNSTALCRQLLDIAEHSAEEADLLALK